MELNKNTLHDAIKASDFNTYSDILKSYIDDKLRSDDRFVAHTNKMYNYSGVSNAFAEINKDMNCASSKSSKEQGE